MWLARDGPGRKTAKKSWTSCLFCVENLLWKSLIRWDKLVIQFIKKNLKFWGQLFLSIFSSYQIILKVQTFSQLIVKKSDDQDSHPAQESQYLLKHDIFIIDCLLSPSIQILDNKTLTNLLFLYRWAKSWMKRLLCVLKIQCLVLLKCSCNVRCLDTTIKRYNMVLKVMKWRIERVGIEFFCEHLQLLSISVHLVIISTFTYTSQMRFKHSHGVNVAMQQKKIKTGFMYGIWSTFHFPYSLQ